MKLITEYNENQLEFFTEAAEGGAKKHCIEGVFAQAENRNRNGRIYPKGILESAVDRYVTDQVSKNRAVGELDHPPTPTVNMANVSHLITQLEWKGNDVIGKASILDTPSGNIVKGLLEGGVQLGVSTRGMGSLVEKAGVSYVKEDYYLSTVDVVQDPSAPTAFVNGIMEGAEWVWNNGILERREVEKARSMVQRAQSRLSESQMSQMQTKLWKDFLNKL